MGRCWLLIVVFLCGCRLTPIDFGRWGLPESGPGSTTELHARMVRVEERLFSEHISPDGMFLYRMPLVPDEHAGWYLDLPDQACWTGYLLAALSFEYSVEPAPRTLERVRLVLASLVRLHTVTGKTGFLAREIVPTHRVSHVAHDLELWRPAVDDPSYTCRVDTSKDQLSGVVFGLVAAGTLVADAEVRANSRDLLLAIARRLHADDLLIRDQDDRVTPYGSLRGRILGIPIGVNAAIALAIMHASTELGGDPLWREQTACRRQQLTRALTWLHFEVLGIRSYSNDVMAAAGLAALGLIPTPEPLRQKLRSQVSEFVSNFRGEGNALFVSVAALHGLRDPVEEQLALQNLMTAPEIPGGRSLSLAPLADLPERWFPGRKWSRRTWEALPIAARNPSSFVWRSDPRELPISGSRKALRLSGVDLLIGYWSGRAAGWIELSQLHTLP